MHLEVDRLTCRVHAFPQRHDGHYIGRRRVDNDVVVHGQASIPTRYGERGVCHLMEYRTGTLFIMITSRTTNIALVVVHAHIKAGKGEELARSFTTVARLQ